MAKLATVPIPSAQTVPVTISAVPGEPPRVSNPEVELSSNEQVEWICEQEFVVYFRDTGAPALHKDGSPFRDRYFHEGKTKSGPPQTGRGTYKYTVECGGYTLDPDVIVK